MAMAMLIMLPNSSLQLHLHTVIDHGDAGACLYMDWFDGSSLYALSQIKYPRRPKLDCVCRCNSRQPDNILGAVPRTGNLSRNRIRALFGTGIISERSSLFARNLTFW
jgi:hypothetical protein